MDRDIEYNDIEDNDIWKYTLGYRICRNSQYYYYVENYRAPRKLDIIKYIYELLRMRKDHYIVKDVLFDLPSKEHSNVWVIIDFEEDVYEAMFNGNFFDDRKNIQYFMRNNGFKQVQKPCKINKSKKSKKSKI
jgi:hypothetical protein